MWDGEIRLGRSAQAVLSRAALLANVRTLSEKTPGASLVAMIKANGYGHGIRQMARRLEGHVAYLGVVSIDEAVAIRDVGVQSSLLIIEGPATQEECQEAIRLSASIVIHREEQILWLEACIDQDKTIEVWLMVDTGMGHLGFEKAKISAILERLKSIKSVRKIVLMSHFACAEDSHNPMNQKQIQSFDKIRLRYSYLASLANSAAIFHYPSSHYDYVRPGIALYGGGGLSGGALQPVMTLRSKILVVRCLNPGDSVGYGAIFRCNRPTRIAVVAMGYGDGYPLNAHDNMPVLIGGRRYFTIGKVAMDRLVVDVTHACVSEVKVGDWAVMWGEGLPVEEVAKASGRSAYELLCGVQNRVQFCWQDDGWQP